MNDSEQSASAGWWKWLVPFAANLLILALMLFVPAGIAWTRGWLFFSVFTCELLIATLYLWRKNPAIFIARSKIHRGTKSWDKIVLVFVFAAFFGTFLVPGLDARYEWTHAPTWAIGLGYGLVTLGVIGSAWVLGVNKFAEPSVRIQTERGHTVITSGPYAIVRHPMYVAAFLFLIGVPLALGSFWGLVPAAIGSIVLVVRTALEDRTLQQELAGYKEYAARVRYRLLPGVW